MPPRVGLRDPVGGLGQVEALEQLVRAHLRRRAPLAVQPPDHHQVLDAGQVLVDRRVLAREPDPRAQLRRVARPRRARRRARCPASGSSSVVSTRTAVVFPAPFGPSTPRTVPGAASRSTPSRARTSPNDFTRPWALMAGSSLIRMAVKALEGSGQDLSATGKIICARMSETTSSRLLTLLSLLQGRRDWPGSRAGRPPGGVRRARSGATSSGCGRSAIRSSR